jgi:hypothetical protein
MEEIRDFHDLDYPDSSDMEAAFIPEECETY